MKISCEAAVTNLHVRFILRFIEITINYQRRLDKQAAKHHGFECLIARVTSLILWLLWSEQ